VALAEADLPISDFSVAFLKPLKEEGTNTLFIQRGGSASSGIIIIGALLSYVSLSRFRAALLQPVM